MSLLRLFALGRTPTIFFCFTGCRMHSLYNCHSEIAPESWIMQPQYEWDEDEDKARINLRKHRISFQEGTTIFNVETMKKTTSKARVLKDEDLRPEYDFKGAVRGRHYRPLDEGYTVQIKKSDGTTVVEHYTLAEGTVLLQPDVREYFPDSASVNAALRSLIALMAELPASRKRKPAPKKRSV